MTCCLSLSCQRARIAIPLWQRGRLVPSVGIQGVIGIQNHYRRLLHAAAVCCSMEGCLFKWGDKATNVAFRSPGSWHACVLFIGGLGDGLLPTPYVAALEQALQACHWGLVQTLLTSSYSGCGISSLEQDAEEIDLLLEYMGRELHCSCVVLMGHSTGCQDIVHYMGRTIRKARDAVKGAVLQGPVSDREYLATLPDTAGTLAAAKGMVREGRGEELLPRSASNMGPITAHRFVALAARGGADDLFSSDLTDEELAGKLCHMAATPCLILFSGEDEYVPAHVDKPGLVRRLCLALGGARGHVIAGGDHSLGRGQQEALKLVVEFVAEIGAKGQR